MPNNKSVNKPDSTPYAQAAGAYGGNAQKSAQDPRETEARVLLKAANMMQDLQERWNEAPPEDLQETLLYNRKIWAMFHDTATENQNKDEMKELRLNIINLSNFIFKQEMEILSRPHKEQLSPLIDINRQISAGLMNSK